MKGQIYYYLTILLLPDVPVPYSSLSGQWKSPNVIGSIPPPCCNFTLNLIRNNKVILCGGKTETGYIDSVYMAEVSVYCVVSVYIICLHYLFH